ncbi:MAG: hypothetical protein ACOYY2_02975 [Actinomycetota bacterium]
MAATRTRWNPSLHGGSWNRAGDAPDVHIGRDWAGHAVEDACCCVQAPCGLVAIRRVNANCAEHDPGATIRQGHPAADCPGRPA